MSVVRISHAMNGDMARLAPLVLEMLDFYGNPIPQDIEEFAATLEKDGPTGEVRFECLIAKDNVGDPIGFAMYSPVYDAAFAGNGIFLRDIYVTSSARGRGIGKALMVALAQECQSRGWRRIDWHVERLDLDARTFYELMAPDSFKLDRLSYRIEDDEIAAMAGKLPPVLTKE